MLKKNVTREEDDAEGNSTQISNNVAVANSVALLDDADNGEDRFEDSVPFSVLSQKEPWRDVYIPDDIQIVDQTKITLIETC